MEILRKPLSRDEALSLEDRAARAAHFTPLARGERGGAGEVPFTSPSGLPLEQRVAAERYGEIEVRFEPAERIYWCHMRPEGRPSYTPGMLRDLSAMQASLRQIGREPEGVEGAPRYFVVGSRVPGIFNLGGDLALFAALIRAADRAALRAYAHACVDVVYHNAVSYDLPLVTIALVQGDALGGGFEAALSCNVIVAERSAKFGLPEVLFNLFPGMGAYSFLARRIAPAEAERMILGGKVYTAEELHGMGLVDVLAEDGVGEDAVRGWIERQGRRQIAIEAVYRTRRRVNPVSLAELRDVTDIWVETAMRLGESDLKRMLRLTAAQDRRHAAIAPAA